MKRCKDPRNQIIYTTTEGSPWKIKRKTVMVGMVAVRGINRMVRGIRRIKMQKRLLDSLLVMILLGSLIQTEIGFTTERSAGLIKLITTVCMQPGIKR